MKKLISLVIYVLRNEKKKILFFVSSVALMFVVLFPYGDLSDLVTAQIAKATNNQVFLEFRDPTLSVFPNVGFSLKNVSVETAFLPSLKAQSLTIAPSILGLVTFKPGLSLSARKILGGDLDLTLKKAKSDGNEVQQVSIHADQIQLSELLTTANLNFPVKGQLALSSEGIIDPNFNTQPSVSISADINRFSLHSDTIATALGPLNLPEVTLQSVNVTGQMRDGRLTVERLTAGQKNDELTADIRGRMDVRILPGGGMTPGAYDFEIRLNIKDSLQQKASLFLSLISGYKNTSTPGVAQYAFRIRGQNMNLPPNISAL